MGQVTSAGLISGPWHERNEVAPQCPAGEGGSRGERGEQKVLGGSRVGNTVFKRSWEENAAWTGEEVREPRR